MLSPRCVALLLAGGCGSRMGLPRPKQFVEVSGQPVLAFTMKAFASHPAIEGVAVVCPEGWDEYVGHWGHRVCGHKFAGSFPGGASSIASARNGTEALLHAGWPGESIVFVHDGARPLVGSALIGRCLQTCLARGNAVACLASDEALLLSSDGLAANGFLPREGVFRAQTPIVLPLHALHEAFVEARRRGLESSQSLFTLLAALKGRPLHIAEGSHLNFKITRPADLSLFCRLTGTCPDASLSSGAGSPPSPPGPGTPDSGIRS